MGRSVTTTGRSEASGTNDLAVLSLAAAARAATPGDAVARAGYCVSQMREAVLAGGVDPLNCATSTVSLNPVHDPWPTVVGYEALFGLRVTVDDLDSVGALLVGVVGAGGDGARVDGIAFSHRDPMGLAKRARDAAYEDALAKATQYAGLAGQVLGELRSITEHNTQDGPFARPMALSSKAADAVTMDPGQGRVRVEVTATWALGPV